MIPDPCRTLREIRAQPSFLLFVKVKSSNSDAVGSMFLSTRELALFECIKSYIRPMGGGPVGSAMVVLTDDNGDQQEFSFQAFKFRHECLTLPVNQAKRSKIVFAVQSR